LEGLQRESLLLLYLLKSLREVKQQATDMRLRCAGADSRGTRRYVICDTQLTNIHHHKIISVLEYEVKQHNHADVYTANIQRLETSELMKVVKTSN
jgi:hypothetical protein